MNVVSGIPVLLSNQGRNLIIIELQTYILLCLGAHTVVTLCVCVCSVRICLFRGLWAQVSVSTDIIPCFLIMQFADLQDKALSLRYGNICLP